MAPRGKRQRRKRPREEKGDSASAPRSIEVSWWSFQETPAPTTTIPTPLEWDDDTCSLSGNSSTQSVIFAYHNIARKQGWTHPTPIQKHTWPILTDASCHAIQVAPTGSGKTVAYSLPLLVSKQNVVVLVPSRELAVQVAEEARRMVQVLAEGDPIVLALHGGVDKRIQLKGLLSKNKSIPTSIFVAATPGRLLDVWDTIVQHTPNGESSSFTTVVLDEADRIASQADLREQVDDFLLNRLDRVRLVLCSATWPYKVTEKWSAWMQKVGPERNCALIQVQALDVKRVCVSQPTLKEGEEQAREAETSADCLARIPDNVEQVLHVCSHHKKPKKLLATLKKAALAKRGIIFFATIKTLKFMSKVLYKELSKKAVVLELHSQLSQTDRQRALDTISRKEQTRPVWLLATDLAARGIHVDNVDCIIQYDFASNLSQYVHRCGRVARSGGKGVAYSFFTRNLAPLATDLVRLLEANDQWVDPNLRQLMTAESNKLNEPSPRKSSPMPERVLNVDDEVDLNDGLSPQNIVLTRADHISDASSDSEEGES